MLSIEKNISLLPYNTFRIDVAAAYFSTIENTATLEEVNDEAVLKNKILILGGGSNVLFTSNLDRWVLHNKIGGIKLVKEDDNHVWLKVGGGEVWHEFVMYCVSNKWGGVENLSLIPGTVGAAPIQNIGAYGVEVKDIIEEVYAYHLFDNSVLVFKNADCAFDYRNSIFKSDWSNKLFIIHVVFKLNKQPVFRTDYGTIVQELEKMSVAELSVKAISDAVISIRESKLPNPSVIGNAGSFFKNPEVDEEVFFSLKKGYPDIIGFKTVKGKVKIPAAWLIEQCGWKGYKDENFGVHQRQALVIVNYGGAQGSELFELSEKIIQSVNQKFGITLQREVQVY